MALRKDKGAITKFGGGTMYVKQVTDAGGAVTGAAWTIMPLIEQSTFAVDAAIEDLRDETGDVVASIETDFVPKLSGIFMQCDKDTLDFLGDTVRGKFYQVIISRGTVDGKVQEVAFAVCKFKPGFQDVTGTRRPPFELTALKNTTGSAITVTPPTGVFTATSFSVAANKYYEIKES